MSETVAAALSMFQRYLDDEILPAAASYALATLMAQPPDVLMQRVATWAAERSASRSLPVRVLLLLALKKIYVTGELNLLDREAVANYLDRATGVAIRLCPEPDRHPLRDDISAMRMSRATTASLQETVAPATMPTLSVPSPSVEAEAQVAKQFSLIFDRLTREKTDAGSKGAPADPQAIAQLLAIAATRSQNAQQLNQYLEQLRPLAGSGEGNVFVILGGGMPSWEAASLLPGSSVRPPSQVSAMEKIIGLAESSEVAMKRFRELVTAAIEKFNQNALGAALWMLDLAEDSISEKKLDMASVDQFRAEAVEMINAAQLRKYAETKSKHAAVKFALEFFPALRLQTLLQNLRREPRAERRRSILGFIEAYGTLGRDAALDELEFELRRPEHATYFLRNLIYLLHRIPRESPEVTPREFDALTKASEPGQLIYAIKEAATALGLIKTEESAKLLTTRLAQFEAKLVREETSSYPAGEMRKLLDRIISALARIGTSAALLTIARHGMKASPLLGDARARLSVLAQYDLSFDESTVDVLLKALREEIPGKLLGRLLPRKQDSTVRLMEALSGTRSEEVEGVFRDIARRFPDHDVGRAAAQVLAKWSPEDVVTRPEATATFAGELEFFGLPAVMQTLGEMNATGMLTIANKQKAAVAKFIFVDGEFLNAQMGNLRGEEVLYQMLERPMAGTFAFVPYPAEKLSSDVVPKEIMGLVLEGMRRNDEMQRLIAIVPDDMTLTKTNFKPTTHEDEDDPALAREVWMKASSGTSIAECERQIATDSFRIRRLVAHWLERGALVETLREA
ncbi:MAG: hypothetical protein QOK37_1630 [Thermoanaerobaculia bacterium]|jgi:hypothetical protein|nr:hypothetical protein [Thermoanaerobaculia bacterium]